MTRPSWAEAVVATPHHGDADFFKALFVRAHSTICAFHALVCSSCVLAYFASSEAAESRFFGRLSVLSMIIQMLNWGWAPSDNSWIPIAPTWQAVWFESCREHDEGVARSRRGTIESSSKDEIHRRAAGATQMVRRVRP